MHVQTSVGNVNANAKETSRIFLAAAKEGGRRDGEAGGGGGGGGGGGERFAQGPSPTLSCQAYISNQTLDFPRDTEDKEGSLDFSDAELAMRQRSNGASVSFGVEN